MKVTLVAATLVAALALPGGNAGPYDGWKPLRYCNDPADMDVARIPPLTESQSARLESLEQVQVLARHGARAPWSRVFCWENQEQNPMNAEWKCGSSSVSSQNVGANASSTGYGRLYRKNYMNGHNVLHGDCTVGGLLEIGRQQHLNNGQFLRDAYIGEGALKLFPTANLSQLPLDRIYLRSDDEERTLGSGQALMDGFFPPDGTLSHDYNHMLAWDVADYAADYISPNEKICPLMTYIWSESMQSTEYKDQIASRAGLTDRFQKFAGKFDWGTALECLGTARCNNLPVPVGVDEDLFNKVFHEVEEEQAIQLSYSDAWYSKVAMQPLAHDIVSRMDKVTEGVSWAPKLAITLGHDSTLMPFLAALQGSHWNRTWTPYAGMVVFEMYKTKNASLAVRVVFHGEALTILGCEDTLCDIGSFFRALEFARKDRTCFVPDDQNTSSKVRVAASDGSDGYSDPLAGLGVTIVAVVVMASLVVVIAVFVGIIQRRRPAPARPARDDGDEESLL